MAIARRRGNDHSGKIGGKQKYEKKYYKYNLTSLLQRKKKNRSKKGIRLFFRTALFQLTNERSSNLRQPSVFLALAPHP